jgi:hypothetical protein
MMRGEPGDTLIVEANIAVAIPRGSHDIGNTQLGQPKVIGVSSVMLSTTNGVLLASEQVAEAFVLRVEDCIGLLGPTVERTHEKREYPRMLEV